MTKYTTKDSHYYLYIMSYGLVTVSKLLSHFLLYENYEECHKIQIAINKFKDLTNQELTLPINKELMLSIVEEMGVTEEFLDTSTTYYKNLILEEIEKKFAT